MSQAIDCRGLVASAIPSEFAGAPVVPDIYRVCIDAAVKGGLYLEFGVYHGKSFRLIRERLSPQFTLYGFDSFEGLPEAWNGFPQGHFATSARPKLNNTELVVGRFEDTIPGFLVAHSGHASFVHIDCDLYSSTRTVLTNLADRIVSGTVILFDEIFGYSGYEQHEYRAFREFIDEIGKGFEPIARWDAYRAAVRIV